MPRAVQSLRDQWSWQRMEMSEDLAQGKRTADDLLLEIAVMDALLRLPVNSHFDADRIRAEVLMKHQEDYPQATECCNLIEPHGTQCLGTAMYGWPTYICDTCGAQCGTQVHPQHAEAKGAEPPLPEVESCMGVCSPLPEASNKPCPACPVPW